MTPRLVTPKKKDIPGGFNIHNRLLDNRLKLRMMKSIQKASHMETDEKLNEQPFTIKRNMFTMCFVSFLDPEKVNPGNVDGDEYLQPIVITDNEVG